MKPFLGIDLTTNKNNEEFNGVEFLVSKPSAVLEDSFNRSANKAEETAEQAKLPILLRIVQGICGVVGVIAFSGILNALTGEDGGSLEQAYQNAPWIFWIGGVCLLIWVILKTIGMFKQKKVFETEESAQVFLSLESNCNAIYAEMQVPMDAEEVNILFFFYKIKKGRIKVCEKGMQLAPYFNPIYKIFGDTENLYLADLEGKYAFPRSSIVSLHTVKEHIRIVGWNKDEQMNKGIYQQFKLTTDNYGCVHCKQYHILEINHNGESLGIYIPNYELPIFEKYLG